MSIDEQVTDVLTKPLSRTNFEYFLENLVWFQRNFLERRRSDDDVSYHDHKGEQ